MLASRHAELCSALDQCKLEFTYHDPEMLMLQELTFLHLHVPFEDISRYIGRGTEDDAQAATSNVHRWFKSSQGRAATWHASQIIRSTKLLSPGNLTDIYAIALFHAGCTLWVWGLMQKVQPISPDMNGVKAVMDEDEVLEVMKFLRTGRGRPCLRGRAGELVPLDDPATVMDLISDIVMSKSGQKPLPLTTEEVLRFMQGFSTITRQKFLTV